MYIWTSESRYRIAGRLFRLWFGDAGGFSYCSFERHFGGFLINVSLPVRPFKTREETLESAIIAAQRLQQWLHWVRWLFDSHDRIQVVVGFPKDVKYSNRQILKCGLPAAALHRVNQTVSPLEYEKLGGVSREMDGWWWELFD